MKFLKSQFNPHFLFNALITHTLSVIKSDKTPDKSVEVIGHAALVAVMIAKQKRSLWVRRSLTSNILLTHLLKDSR
ncbi:MAG: histidine kinase [Saprospiraceae bacterium]